LPPLRSEKTTKPIVIAAIFLRISTGYYWVFDAVRFPSKRGIFNSLEGRGAKKSL